MAFDISSFVIDRAIRGTMFKKGTFDLLWTLTQITDPSLNMTADTEDAVDAIGIPIMTFERNKQCEFSGSTSACWLLRAAPRRRWLRLMLPSPLLFLKSSPFATV